MNLKAKAAALFVFSLGCITACEKDKKPDDVQDESANYTVTTIAGSDFGYVNGTGTAAKFNFPTGLALDASGTIYVADRDNNRIRKIGTDNVVTTYAGTGVAGGTDGSISSAQFDGPRFLAFDPAGNLLVIDSMRLRLRKITPGGTVSTVNLNRTPGYADGPLSTAQFSSLDDLAIDAAGNIFIPDGINHRIRKISAAGMVTTVAGSGETGYQDGSAATAKFIDPMQITVDQQGNLYVKDASYIRKISSGNVTTFATIGDPGSVLNLVYPSAIKVDAQGTVYTGISQSLAGSYIAKLSATGTLTKIAGGMFGFADGPGSSARINSVMYMITGPNNTIYFIDEERIRKVTKN